MRRLNKIFMFLLLSLPLLAACSETDETTYAGNWAADNRRYFDSIATVARANSAEWRVISSVGLDETVEHANEYYVFCKVLSSGIGTEYPAGNDTVLINYKGQLIDGTVFDASYDGELNPEYETPVEMALDNCVWGFSTAVQQMVSGDIWEVYIPNQLAYGADGYGAVEPSSTLIFTLNLVKSFHVGDKE